MRTKNSFSLILLHTPRLPSQVRLIMFHVIFFKKVFICAGALLFVIRNEGLWPPLRAHNPTHRVARKQYSFFPHLAN
jgi:hypothetical protein